VKRGHVDTCFRQFARQLGNTGRVCGLELYSGVPNVPKNKSKE
jgi:hypothetical protein